MAVVLVRRPAISRTLRARAASTAVAATARRNQVRTWLSASGTVEIRVPKLAAARGDPGGSAAEYDGERVVGLCDAGEERFFRRVLPDATYVCVKDIEDELLRAVGVPRVEALLEAQGELVTFRHFQNQPAWRGRPAAEGLPRWLQSADRRRYRYLPLLVEMLGPDEIPAPLAGVLAAAAA